MEHPNLAILKMGHGVGIDTPIHRSIVALIHTRERT